MDREQLAAELREVSEELREFLEAAKEPTHER
jgi:preprotein translocase subunit Sss1